MSGFAARVCQPSKRVARLRWRTQREPPAARLEFQRVQMCCDITNEAYRRSPGGAHVWDGHTVNNLVWVIQTKACLRAQGGQKDVTFILTQFQILYAPPNPPSRGPEY